MPRRYRFLPVLTLLALALGVPAARATQVMHLDTQALVHGSDDIVVGQIENVQPRWNTTHTKIFTDVSVRVTQALKGGAGDLITLTQLGGEVDGVRYNVPGCPAFTRGEEALLFVWRGTRGQPQVTGLAQGKFDIRRDAATGVATVQRSMPGLAVRDPRMLKLVPQGQPAPRIPLDDLLREIHQALDQEGGR
jgi:hypothetical protein